MGPMVWYRLLLRRKMYDIAICDDALRDAEFLKKEFSGSGSIRMKSGFMNTNPGRNFY